MAEEVKQRSYKSGGLVFVACMFVGIGIGKVAGATGVGTLIGIGVGFLAMAILANRK